MSSQDERRKGARFFTDLSVNLRSAKNEPLDERATAHDVSVVGFKLETQAPLEKGATVNFTLDLPEGERVSGRGLVVWAKRETFATWAGIKISKMSWGDKRKISSMLNPDSTDWDRIADLGTKAALLVVIVIGAQNLFLRPHAGLESMSRLLPKFAAVLVMAWALRGMLSGRR